LVICSIDQAGLELPLSNSTRSAARCSSKSSRSRIRSLSCAGPASRRLIRCSPSEPGSQSTCKTAHKRTIRPVSIFVRLSGHAPVEPSSREASETGRARGTDGVERERLGRRVESPASDAADEHRRAGCESRRPAGEVQAGMGGRDCEFVGFDRVHASSVASGCLKYINRLNYQASKHEHRARPLSGRNRSLS
jgi:hypothetical protein